MGEVLAVLSTASSQLWCKVPLRVCAILEAFQKAMTLFHYSESIVKPYFSHVRTDASYALKIPFLACDRWRVGKTFKNHLRGTTVC